NEYYESIVQLPGKEKINGRTFYTFHSYDKDIKKGKTLYFDENGALCRAPYQTTTQPKVQPTPNHVNTPSNTQTPTSTSRPQTTNTIDTTAPTAATETQTTDSVSTTTQPQTSSNLFVKGHDVKAIGKFNGTPMAKEIEENTEEPNLAKALESYHETTFSTKGTQEAIFVRLNDSKIGSEEAILREALGSNIKPDSDLAETFLAFHNKENMQNEYYESIVQLPGKENINGRTFYTFHSYDKDIKKGKTLYFDENGNRCYTQEQIKAARENEPRLYFSGEEKFTPEDMEEIVNLYLNNVDFSTLNNDERAMIKDFYIATESAYSPQNGLKICNEIIAPLLEDTHTAALKFLSCAEQTLKEIESSELRLQAAIKALEDQLNSWKSIFLFASTEMEMRATISNGKKRLQDFAQEKIRIQKEQKEINEWLDTVYFFEKTRLQNLIIVQKMKLAEEQGLPINIAA
ncbi:hypothetical protein IJE86_06820, partial [bacterium]|nr:hypothetical protein [bacterium]